jgi:hypothetical protein
MPWTKNKKLVAEGLRDLAYLPKGRSEWDWTLAALAFAARRIIEARKPSLAEWAARHGLSVSRKWLDLGEEAAVLWHGTSDARADKIADHGLFSKGGLWTTSNPFIAHGFTRGRSDRFGVGGAMVCLVMDRREYECDSDFVVDDGQGEIFKFYKGLPADVVEYVLYHDHVEFRGDAAPEPRPWPSIKLKRRHGEWIPAQKPPVRYDDDRDYSTVEEFAAITFDRLFDTYDQIAAVELFSVLYALISPWDAIEHDDVLGLLEANCTTKRQRSKRKLQVFERA